MSSEAKQNVVRLEDIRAGEIIDQVAKTVSSMADHLTDSVQSWSSKARAVARNTDGFVRSSPWQAVGIIALAGLATGLLVSYAARGRQRRLARGSDESYYEHSGG
jgi:ElaB/YqjD/DUF883 family membrane-anchored ribosome-binding protein